MKIEIPKTFRGREIEGAIDRVLDKQKSTPQPSAQPIQPTNTLAPANINMNDYIQLPSGLYVAKERTLQNHNWYDAHKELHKQGLRMPTIPQFVEFINYLKNGYSNRQEADSILDEILTVRSPWRAEWLDAKFEKSGQMNINYNHQVKGDNIVPQTQEKLENYLAKDKTPGIDLDDWLNNPTKQGLPSSKSKNGDLYYWYPRDGFVARFVAGSGRAILYCSWNPDYRDDTLGVRGVASAEGTS